MKFILLVFILLNIGTALAMESEETHGEDGQPSGPTTTTSTSTSTSTKTTTKVDKSKRSPSDGLGEHDEREFKSTGEKDKPRQNY